MGGSGRNGGGGGRVGIVYNITSYTGEFRSKGGVGTQGENGAAGTVYLNNIQSQPERKLVIYNQGGSGVRVRGIPYVWGNSCHQYNRYMFFKILYNWQRINQIIYVLYESLLFITVPCIVCISLFI